MSAKFRLITASVLFLSLFAAFAADAEPPKPEQPAGQPEFKLPPGWTEADMQACMFAATPGKMHERLLQDAGVWEGKITMWMAPGAEPVQSQGTNTISALMDGRFVKIDMDGEMPGMGPYKGLSLIGFDNVSQKFSSVWIDNHGTGMSIGEGELSPDGKTLTWKFTYNCPITKRPTVMRQIETATGPTTKKLEMFGVEPKSSQEYKMMRMELTKKQ